MTRGAEIDEGAKTLAATASALMAASTSAAVTGRPLRLSASRLSLCTTFGTATYFLSGLTVADCCGAEGAVFGKLSRARSASADVVVLERIDPRALCMESASA